MKEYRKNPLFVARKMMDQGFLVPVSEYIQEMRKVYKLNELGWFIWENLERKSDVEGMASLIYRKYSVDKATALSDLTAFLEKLLHSGALIRRERN
jgi:hypothetical protein